MYKDKPIYLVVATSGRAIAQALKAGGNTAVVIDGFADMDTRVAAEVCEKVTRTKFGLKANEVLQAIDTLQYQFTFAGLFYDAALETNPDLLDSIAIDHVIGNTSYALRQCKDPKVFFSMLDQYAIPYPEVSFAQVDDSMDPWLVKHATSSGGVGVSENLNDFTLAQNCYFQKKINGVCFSLTFLANGNELKPLGFNTLWSEFHEESTPYAYAGAINWADLTQQQQDLAINYAKTIVCAFKLVGLNSIDYILLNDVIYVLEINPRIPATYELYETKHGDLLEKHINACMLNKLVVTESKPLLRAHAILYAPEIIRVPANISWPIWTADRPQAQQVINQYEPVCSVFAGGKNVAQVRDMIHTRKKTIINKLLRY